MAELEQAPPNSLPTWSDCALIIDNAEFRNRAAAGLEGSVIDTPPTTPEPTELHRFIYEYDDADPYRSAWFMHRLELVLNEAKAEAMRNAGVAVGPAPRALDEFKACGGDEEPDPLERLRFFCSLAFTNGQDWLDVEPFFDAVIAQRNAGVPPTQEGQQ